ncbi:hypothetical protein GX586_06185, partial [bacterium]|nr:hypothetical protein [bacterium]
GVFVASEDLEPGDGWPYDLFLADLKANPLMTPAQLGACIVARYGKYYATRGEAVTQSCLDLTKLPALSSAVDAFAVAALDAPPAWNSIIAARATASWYSDKAFRDLEGIAGQLSSSSLSNEARAVSAAFHQALITNYSAAVLGGRGLTVYFPNGAVDSDYAAAHIQFARDTQWDEFIRALQPTPPANDSFTSPYALLTAYGSTAGNNEGATAEPGEPRIAGVTPRHSLWWSFTPPWSASEFEIDTQGSDFDTVLGVFTGTTVSTLRQIVANDDERNGLLTSRVVVTNPAAGITYQIAVDGYGGDTGSIALNWNLVPEPACAVAVVLLTVRRRARR